MSRIVIDILIYLRQKPTEGSTILYKILKIHTDYVFEKYETCEKANFFQTAISNVSNIKLYDILIYL
jgi:hypothetical protein